MVIARQTKSRQTKSKCVYCEKPDHRSSDCKTAKTVTEPIKILSDKKLCFNCKELNTGPRNSVVLRLA